MTATTLDIEQPQALLAYLRERGHIGASERVEIRNLAGGVSNRTVWLGRESGESWVLKQALAKLRVKVDWFSDPARVHREAAGIRAFAQLAPGRVPPLVFEDFEHHLIAMQAVPQPHDNWKDLLLAGRGTVEQARQFGTLLGRMHAGAFAQRERFASEFADVSFFQSLRLEPYYLYAAQQVPPAGAFLRQLVADTLERRFTLVHGDYSPKNILVHRGELVLLDHEVIHWGDPAFDLGFSLAHLLSKGHFLGDAGVIRALPGAYVEAYRAAAGAGEWQRDLWPFAVRHTLGCLLARVRGRSTLEYLSESCRAKQQAVVVALMADGCDSLESLFVEFFKRV
jgi:tRNA A-37 threonylcarbamoyl transferase component Bud32